jgi:hypothetical protein
MQEKKQAKLHGNGRVIYWVVNIRIFSE